MWRGIQDRGNDEVKVDGGCWEVVSSLCVLGWPRLSVSLMSQRLTDERIVGLMSHDHFNVLGLRDDIQLAVFLTINLHTLPVLLNAILVGFWES
jgi:hypothetical protein